MNLTLSDILFASIAALVLTWLIKRVNSILKIVRVSEFIQNDPNNKEVTNNILQKCYNLFPKDIIQFRGQTFKRGMNIKIITNQHKIIEGKLIGMNNQNILCIITQKYIIAHEINNIEEITSVEESK